MICSVIKRGTYFFDTSLLSTFNKNYNIKRSYAQFNLNSYWKASNVRRFRYGINSIFFLVDILSIIFHQIKIIKWCLWSSKWYYFFFELNSENKWTIKMSADGWNNCAQALLMYLYRNTAIWLCNSLIWYWTKI